MPWSAKLWSTDLSVLVPAVLVPGRTAPKKVCSRLDPSIEGNAPFYSGLVYQCGLWWANVLC